LLPSEPAEHLHRQAHAGDVSRHIPQRPSACGKGWVVRSRLHVILSEAKNLTRLQKSRRILHSAKFILSLTKGSVQNDMLSSRNANWYHGKIALITSSIARWESRSSVSERDTATAQARRGCTPRRISCPA